MEFRFSHRRRNSFVHKSLIDELLNGEQCPYSLDRWAEAVTLIVSRCEGWDAMDSFPLEMGYKG